MTRLMRVEPDAGALVADVSAQEYARLLGMPRSLPVEGALAERAEWARSWYARHGRPHVAARRLAVERLGPDSAAVEPGVILRSLRLAARLRAAHAHALVAVAVTAGPEVDTEAERLWQDGRPDEAYFLDRFGAAVAERLVYRAMAWACRLASPEGETVLPHLSPGCGDWDLGDQGRLMGLVAGGDEAALAPLSMLESGMLRPKGSVLAAFGVTRGTVMPSPAGACRDCDLDPCRFRRAPRAARTAAGGPGPVRRAAAGGLA